MPTPVSDLPWPTLVGGADGTALAAALALKQRLIGRRVGLICSGDNGTPAQLRALFSGS